MKLKHKISIALTPLVAIAPVLASAIGANIPAHYQEAWMAFVAFVAAAYHAIYANSGTK